MDYSDDSCMYLFTQEQVELMRKAFDIKGSRVSILSSKGCDIPAENEISYNLSVGEYPEDISWEILDSSDNIIASDGDFPPGDESTGAPSPFVDSTLTYIMDFPDGDYVLKLYDDFGDGFEDGGYEIKNAYGDVLISGIGPSTDSLITPFTLSNANYIFHGNQGTDTDWYNPENWNRHAVPNKCFADDIIIEADCIVDKLTFDDYRNMIIREEAKLMIQH